MPLKPTDPASTPDPPEKDFAGKPATLGQLAEFVGGTVRGDPTVTVTDAGPLDDAAPGTIVLVDHADRVARGDASDAAALFVPSTVTTKNATAGGKPAIAVDDLHSAFRQVIAHFHPPHATPAPGVATGAVVDPSAVIDPTATIHPGAVVGAGVKVGAETQVFPNATLYPGVAVGNRCLVHAGAVIGAYGFGYSQTEGRHVLAAQLGAVEVGDDVEIGAGTCIDRGVYGPTRIGEGTKIDNLVQVGHNCQIGRHNLICSQVGIAGSTSTGDYVVMAGQAGVRDHVTIGDGAQLGAMCGVSNDVPAGASMLGAPATPVREQKLRFAAVAKLPEMRKEMKALRKQVAQLMAERDPSITTEAGAGPATEAEGRAA